MLLVEITIYNMDYLIRLSVFWPFFGFLKTAWEKQTQIEVIWKRKIGMMISNKGETNVKVVWGPHQLIWMSDRLKRHGLLAYCKGPGPVLFLRSDLTEINCWGLRRNAETSNSTFLIDLECLYLRRNSIGRKSIWQQRDKLIYNLQTLRKVYFFWRRQNLFSKKW